MPSGRWERSEPHDFIFSGLCRPAPQEPGPVRPAGRVLFLLYAADHRLCLHDALPHHSHRPSGRGRLPQTGDHDLCSGGPRLRRLYCLCRRAILPPEIPGDRSLSGSGGHPPPAAKGAGTRAGRSGAVFLCRWGCPGRASGLGHLAAVPPFSGGFSGDGSLL